MTSSSAPPAPHPDRFIAAAPLVRFAQADVQFASPVAEPAACLDALRAVSPEARLVLPSAQRVTPGGDRENVYFALVVDADCIAVAESGMIVDTVAYGSWDRFNSVIERSLEAIAPVTSIASSSADLRYVDEVRRPESESDPTGGDLEDSWFQQFVRFPIQPGSDPLRSLVDRSYGGYRFASPEECAISMQWSITDGPALGPAHPLSDQYQAPGEAVLAMDWYAHVHGDEPLTCLANGYQGISQVFWEAITDKCREMMGADS